MYCMDFLQAIRLHNESVQMIHDSQMQMIRTIDRMNERLYRVIEEQSIEEPRQEQQRESSTRLASRRTQRGQRSQRTPSGTQPVSSSSRNTARNTARTTTGEQANPHGPIHRPRRQDSIHPGNSLNSLNSIASLFRNGLSNGTNRNGYIQYYWFPINTVQQNVGNMESVPIPVSEEVISTVCRVYSYEQDSSGNTSECPIDLSPFQQGDEIMEIRHCGHRFRSSNLRRWFQSNPRCPLCRVDVRDISNEIDHSGNAQEENGDTEEQESSTLPILADTPNILSTPTQPSQPSQPSESIFRAPTTDSFRSTSTSTHAPFTNSTSIRNHTALFDSSGNLSNTHTLESLLTTTLEDLFTSAFQEPEN